jgi:hypothetical protein
MADLRIAWLRGGDVLCLSEWGWPLNAQLLDTLGGGGLLAAIAYSLNRRYRTAGLDEHIVEPGIAIGLLWAIEITFNNLPHAPLPVAMRTVASRRRS